MEQERIIKILQSDIEMTESVGCAFAFDLAKNRGAESPTGVNYDLVDLRKVLEAWDDALDSLGAP